LTPTVQDVARHHRRWNTGSTALALYWHDWKFSVPLKHLLCPHVHTLNFSGQVGRTGKTYAVTTWCARRKQQQQQQQQQQRRRRLRVVVNTCMTSISQSINKSQSSPTKALVVLRAGVFLSPPCHGRSSYGRSDYYTCPAICNIQAAQSSTRSACQQLQLGVSDGNSSVSRRQQITLRATTLIFHLVDGLSTTAAHEVRRAGVLTRRSCHPERSARPHPHRG